MAVLEPIWEKRNYFIGKPDLLKQILESGSEKARDAAKITMDNTRKAIGL